MADIKHKNFNKNKKFNKNRNNNEGIQSAYNQPKYNPKADKRYDPGKQTHLFAKLEERYGQDFMGFADTKKEINRYTLMGLLKTIYRGGFDFDKYGMYLTDPRFLERVIPLAETNSKQAYVHMCGDMILENNPQLLMSYNVPMNDFRDIVAVDKVKNAVWAIIYQAFTAVRNFNPYVNQGPPYTPIKVSVNDMININCNRGYPAWNYIE